MRPVPDGAMVAGNRVGTRLTPKVLSELREARKEPIRRTKPFNPTLPLLLDGELVEDLEKMNADHPGNLYVTPVPYRSALALAAFTDPEPMLAEAREMTFNEELHQLVREHGLGCLPDGAPAPSVLTCHDRRDLAGDTLNLFPETFVPDLSQVPRVVDHVFHTTWDNCIFSVDVCAYPYSASSEVNFRGITHFINFRCAFNPTAFGFNTSSIVNWGTLPPDY